MSAWFVVWLVLMVLWGLSCFYNPAPGGPHPYPWATPILAWACVLILGLMVSGAIATR